MSRATVVSVGPKFTRVEMHEGHERRVSNDLVQLDSQSGYAEAYGLDPRDRPLPFGRYTAGRSFAPGRWLPRWSWMGWTVAEHLAYVAGLRPLEDPPADPPKRLVIVGCGGKKSDRRLLDAHGMYVGSYHRAARRAADALVARDPGRFGVGSGRDCYQIILSGKYGLLDLFDVIERYDLLMGEPGSVTAETVRYQAEQLGLLDAEEVIVLAGRKYADVVSAVWPHALRPLDGTAGIGPQLQRLAAITATGTIPEPKEPTVSVSARPIPPCDVYPVRLKAGDVIDVPGRGEITLASDGNVRSSKPTVTWFKVHNGEPFEIDAFHGGTVRLVRRVDPGTLRKPAAPAQRKVPEPTRKPPAAGREVPLAEVGWGTYGWIKAMGPDGSASIQTGYVTEVPRIHTGGLMTKPKLTGKPHWYFVMVDPGRTNIGMHALLDAKFFVLDPPADRPLSQKPNDSRRVLARDTRAGDLVEVTFPDEDRHLGRYGPEVDLTEDPRDVGDGYVELTGTVAGGQVETFMLRGEGYVSVEGLAVRHLVHQDPAAKTTKEAAGGRELPAPGDTEPDARWLLLGQVSPGEPGTAEAQLRRARMYAAMRRVHELPIAAPIGEILAARDDVDCRWSVKCDAYWRAYAALMNEEGAARTAAAEPFPAGEPTVDGNLPAPRDLIPAERWWMLEVVSAIYGTAAAAARRRRILAAKRRVHDLPADATVQQIEAAQEVDVRRHPMRCWAYWDAYAALLAEESAARTIREEPLPKPAKPVGQPKAEPAAKHAAAPVRAARKRKPSKQQIPLTEVTWGAYGEVKGFHPDGSRYTGKGYLTLLPRICTAGMGEKAKFKGEPLLKFDLYEPYGGNRGGSTVVGMAARLDGMFTPLDPPADRPLDVEPSDVRRMPVVDLRADDILPPEYHGDPNPAMHLLEDPKPLGQGRFELKGLVEGVITTRRMNGDTWVTVDGPALRRRAADHGVEEMDAFFDALEAEFGTALDANVGDEAAPGAVSPAVDQMDDLLAALEADIDTPPNAGPVLDELLAAAENPKYGRNGRKSARDLAERYAAGLPLVRFNRLLNQQWIFNCPVPTCGLMYDGHNTLRETRDHWFEHAAQHEGFVAAWPDDILPVEDEEPAAEQTSARKATRKKKLPRTAVIEIVEPVGNDWWDDAALRWERCGTLRRMTVRRVDGREAPVAVLTFSQGRAKAAGFAELLSSIGGIDPAAMHVRTLDESAVPAYEAPALFDWDDFATSLEAELSRV
ncbi:DUF6884 domain-containing protein [Micromonospora sp. DT227]|uniref:DUF6884 domain-containing protein n=1 Tax=Micromonospora sp. DT227 TaxID=3393433 RepID=UPI003CF03127